MDARVSLTPFQVFRRWARRAPAFQKASALAAAMAVLAVLCWAVVPAGSQSGTGSSSFGGGGAGGRGQAGASTAGTQAGAAAASSAGGSAGAASGNAGGQAAGGAAAATAGATSGSHCLSGTTTGVSATQVKVAVLIVNVAGPAADSTFGIASPAAQQAAFQAVVNNINATGGVACRKIVPTFYQANPVDQSGLQQLCLTIVQSGVFAVVDPGAYANYAAGLDCYAQNHIPYFEGYQLDGAQVQHDYPYLFSFDTLNSSYKNGVFALKQLGFFTNGFKKLGIIYRDCYSDVVSQVMSWLTQAGVPPSNVVSYDMGCPEAFPPASDYENAIVKFQQAGVTNMTEIFGLGDMAQFTDVANTQNFHPKWGIGDDGILEISNGSEAPNPNELNGAIGITASRNGENNTSGLTPTAGTQKCNAIMQAVGLSPVYGQGAAVGNACDQLWMLQAALDHAPALSPAAMAVGLQRAGSIDFSYPQGPNNFAGGSTVGGQYWRVDTYTSACSCWKVANPNFSPSF